VTKVRSLVLMVGALALIFIGLLLQLLTPGNLSQQNGPGAVHITFSAEHGMVIAPGSCLTIQWQVDHVRRVYVNGLLMTDQATEEVCGAAGVSPVFRVELMDGTSASYPIEIKYLSEQPSTWILLGAVLLLIILCVLVAVRRPVLTTPVPAVQRTAKPVSRFVRMFTVIGVLLTSLILLTLAVEFGLRFYFTNFGSRGAQDAYLSTRAQLDTHLDGKVVLPFVEFGLLPDYPGHNSLGYRGDEVQVPKPDGVYRIVALGDSTTYGTLAAYDQTYPYDLQQVFRVDYGMKNVEVINAGVSNYTSWNILADLEFRVAELQPDLVIVYQGSNDLPTREVSPDCYNSPTPFLGLDPRRQIHAAPGELSTSALYRFIAIRLGWMRNPALTDSDYTNSQLVCSPQVQADIPQNLAANAPVYFERNTRDMIAIAKASGYPIMFMTFAYNPNSSDLPDYERAAIAQQNTIIKQVAQKDDALLFDYAAIAPTDKNSWSDRFHPSVQGNIEQAQLIAKFLIDQQVLAPRASS
jgi:lysophospholipase L1-like esterase